ncbi:hypothetical protein OSB04_005388 [Centaurea solstitialis]|uniref:Uncharacterized protein n=1 Tax=Centaurea solstitialis TaxID=347529 RepID=A0AA38U0K2_9ASTR|nr:hypothetical protein OSB04_005388 [Centaurea solstitialis]
MSLKDSYVKLSLVIHGRKSHIQNFVVFLRPLIDGLKMLNAKGALTYNAYRKINCEMRTEGDTCSTLSCPHLLDSVSLGVAASQVSSFEDMARSWHVSRGSQATITESDFRSRAVLDSINYFFDIANDYGAIFGFLTYSIRVDEQTQRVTDFDIYIRK